MKQLLFILACVFVFISGCEEKNEQPPPAKTAPQVQVQTPVPLLETASLLREPIEATLVELPAKALPVWRQFQASKPALVFLSQDPFLQQIPTDLRKEVIALIQNGSPEDLIEKTSFSSPAPLLLPMMAISSALRSNLFSEVVWVFPSTLNTDQLNVESFRQQLLDLGAVDEEEAQSVTLHEGGFAGTVRGTSFRAVPIDALPPFDGPAVLHIDLGYFQPLYKGEIKTRMYPFLYDSLRKLRDSGWNTAAVSISHSNINGALPLAVRFIGPTLASLLKKPEILDEPLPLNWQRRADALYLVNFFKNQEIRDLYLEVEAERPEDASAKDDLYQISRELKEGGKALDYLEQAVALDPVYAIEYLSLATVAKEKGRPDQSIKMLRLAEQAMPDNPYISMQLAAQLIELNHSEQAIKILDRLIELPWSKVYYPDMAKRLEAMAASGKERRKAGEGDRRTNTHTENPEH
jgi:tetratricopeptide (TPR) repeat protein